MNSLSTTTTTTTTGFTNLLQQAIITTDNISTSTTKDISKALQLYPGLESKGGTIIYRSKPANFLTTTLTSIQSLIILGSFIWVPFTLWYTWKKCRNNKKRKLIFFVVILIMSFYPIRESKFIRRNWIWNNFYRYFQITAVADGFTIDPKKNYLFAVFPHGIFPWSLAAAAVGDLSEVLNKFRPVVASALFRFPFMRQVVTSVGAIEAKESSISQVLKQGDSLGVIPGGIGEMYLGYPRPGCLPDEEYILCKDHKGFVRLAIKHGISLVPVYCFGNTKTLHRAQIPLWVEKLSRYLKASFIIAWGRWFLPIPFKIPLLYAVGKPIEIIANKNPSSEEIDIVHQKFCKAIIELFNKYKDSYGWGHKTLRIV